jgi:mRNA interferase MazF
VKFGGSAGLNVGVEADGKNENFERPMVIIKKFNADMVWVLPLTTKDKKNEYHFKLTHEVVTSWVILSQVKTISTKRLLRKIGSVSKADMITIVSKVQSLLSSEQKSR